VDMSLSCIYYIYELIKFIKNVKKSYIFFHPTLSVYKILTLIF
jgi:hypothetical protein